MLIRDKSHYQKQTQEILTFRNFRLVKLSNGELHYTYANQKKLIQGRWSQDIFRLLPLLGISLMISSVLGFGMESIILKVDARQAANYESSSQEGNEEEDLRAKKADQKYLEETEDRKWAILRSDDLDPYPEPEKNKKLTVTAYRVKPNETLAEIAARFKVSPDSIAGSSGIDPEKPIYPGQILQIPNKQGLLYKLKKGDTLAKIADFYKVKMEAIIAENGNLDYDFLQVGQKIFLPGAVLPEPTPRWVSPVSSKVITSGYGWRDFPDRKYHKALDFRANYEPVYAARKGIVTFSGWMGGYGNMIVIQHDNDYKTLYAHNSKLLVKAGSHVQVGQKIAISGCTGYCFGPHLHFEVIHKGDNINPMKVIKGLKTR